jgi:hypothetical protein
MHKIFFLTKQNSYKEIYSINFKVYLNCETQFLSSKNLASLSTDKIPEQALFFIDATTTDEDLDLVITKNNEAYKDKITILSNDREYNFPDHYNIVPIPNALDVKLIIKTSAQIFSLSASEMVNLKVPDYYPMPRKIFKFLDQTPCNVYIKKDAGYTLLWGENSKISKEEYFQYVTKRTFYVPAMDRLKLLSYANPFLMDQAKENSRSTDPEEIKIIESTINELATSFSKNPEVNEEIIALSENCMNEIDLCLEKQMDFHSLFELLKSNMNHYIHVHGILGSFIARKILESQEWATHEHIEKISYSFFFQDLLLVPIYLENEELQTETELFLNLEQSRYEKDTILYHARNTSEIIQQFPNAPLGVESVIIQHHGSPTGFGLVPNPQDNISPLAKIIVVAERFVEESYQYLTQNNFTPEIKQSIIEKMKKNFSKRSYQKLINTLEQLQF